ncbi:MAG: hypothetical protein GW946_00995 [Candidatus Pacebacteria bacterium]|nr:hypothetical protein [Candidatus Paceibacterota bacterium]PIR60687.1 MAG: hypothetical protein COU67_00995 [Candidatus Pacebacteria bacterium CG10_big_fil_rev_8_21_14_0_10_44_54]
MNTQTLQFKIENLRATTIQRTLEGLFTVVASLFVTALLPSLLIKYFYANAQLFEQPKLLEYIPVATFAISGAYIVFVIVGNFSRGAKIRQAESELALSESMTANDLGTTQEELAELEKIVDNALAKPNKSKRSNTKKSTRKKSAK